MVPIEVTNMGEIEMKNNWLRVIVVVLLALLVVQPVLSNDSSLQSRVPWPLNAELAQEKVGEDTESLLAALNHTNSTVRWIAAQMMGERKVRAAIPQLVALLQDKSSMVRAEAAGALLEMGDKSGVSTLKTMLDSKIKREYVAAARILAAHGDDTGLDKVRPLLRSGAVDDRWSAVRVLGESHNAAEAYPALRQGVNDENESARCIALNMLQKKATPEAIEILGGMLQSARPVDRRMAASALVQVRKTEAIPFIIGALADDDLPVRMTAAIGITYLTGHKIASSTKKRVKSIEDAKGVQSEWQQWWQQNKAAFVLEPPAKLQYAD